MNCQKCRAPLKLDHSVENLNPAAFELLTSSSRAQPEEPTSPTSRPLSSPERSEIYDKASQNASSPTVKRSVPASRRTPATNTKRPPTLRDSSSMSFILLTESQVRPTVANGGAQSHNHGDEKSLAHMSGFGLDKQPLSKQAEASMRLFEIISARSDIDHPVCNECTELLLNSLQARLSASMKERDAYVSFLKELKHNVPTAEEVSQAESDLAAAKLAEKKAFDTLVSLESEKSSLEEEIADLEVESRALDQEEEAYWRSRNAFDVRLASLCDSRDALNASFDHDTRQLERLRRTNVYNDTFCIGHDGHFGTINGLRLGRLAPPNHVEWSEINAAWGVAALLLATVADRLRFSFRGYILRPMGSTSRIDRLEHLGPSAASSTVSSRAGSVVSNALSSHSDSGQSPTATRHPRTTALELFSSGDLPLGRQLLHRRFNDAMVAFLDCLAQLGDFVEKSGGSSGGGGRRRPGAEGNSSVGHSVGLRLPYLIEKDKIHGVSIKLGVSQDDAWTSACKYTLTCCKFLLAHASNVASGDESK